jgi:hypothetical protein
MKLELQEDGIVTLDADRYSDARAIPGAKYSDELRTWTLPLAWSTCIVARAVLGGDLEVGPALSAWAGTEKKRVDEADAARAAEAGPAWQPAVSGDPDDVVDRNEAGEVVADDGEPDRWWEEVYGGMPEWIHAPKPVWKDLTVHFRNPDDYEEFGRKLTGRPLPTSQRSIFYPLAEQLKQSEWRWVDADSDPASLPATARSGGPEKPGRKAKGGKPSTKAAGGGGTALDALLGSLT